MTSGIAIHGAKPSSGPSIGAFLPRTVNSANALSTIGLESSPSASACVGCGSSKPAQATSDMTSCAGSRRKMHPRGDAAISTSCDSR